MKKEENERKDISEFKKNENKVSASTMSNVGKEVTLANQEYLVAPINIYDMPLIDNYKDGLFLPILNNKDLDPIFFTANITDPKKADIFYYIVEKYVKYKDGKMPVNKEMIEEHCWSCKDIKKFLQVWLEVSD